MSQEQKIALVTGAGSGIGRATTIALANDGWFVLLTGRSETSLLETASLCPSDRTDSYPTDVSKPDEVQRLFQFILNKYGRLDLLFNNAGIGMAPTLLEDVPFDQWNEVMQINVSGSFLCARRHSDCSRVRILKVAE